MSFDPKAYGRAWSKRKAAERKAEGKCPSCGNTREDTTLVCCRTCRLRASKNGTEKSRARRKRLESVGLCVRCGKQSTKDTKVCGKCRGKTKTLRLSYKKTVVDRYGGECTCCQETELGFLTIDHIDNGGNKHRTEIGVKSGASFYKWIIENDYPDFLRVLCFNCNCGRQANGGVCPHHRTDR